MLLCGDYFCGPPELAWIYCYYCCTEGSGTGCSKCRQSDTSRVKRNNCFPWTAGYALLIQPRMLSAFVPARTHCRCVLCCPPGPSNPFLFSRTVRQPACPQPVLLLELVPPKGRTWHLSFLNFMGLVHSSSLSRSPELTLFLHSRDQHLWRFSVSTYLYVRKWKRSNCILLPLVTRKPPRVGEAVRTTVGQYMVIAGL